MSNIDFDTFLDNGKEIVDEQPVSIFSNKVVVFLDILGTTDKIGMDEIDKNELQNIVDKVLKLREYIQTQIRGLSTVGISSIAISDCFILATDLDNIDDILLILSKTIKYGLISDELILLRGGISYGQVSIQSESNSIRQIMGPAYNAAYGLESKISEYPRVIINPDLKDKINNGYIYHDNDGICSIDFINILEEKGLLSGKKEFINESISKIKATLTLGTFKMSECRKNKKRNWLINYLEKKMEE